MIKLIKSRTRVQLTHYNTLQKQVQFKEIYSTKLVEEGNLAETSFLAVVVLLLRLLLLGYRAL